MTDQYGEARYRDLRVVTDDGVSLAVRDRGPRTAGHTVVFLHGLCLTRASWAGQIDYVTKRYGPSVRVISYDHRGHGRSGAAPVSTYRIERLAADLAQVLAVTQVSGRLTLVGHSMGGMTALAYLGRAQRPVEAHGLILVATAAGKLAQRGLGRLLATRLTAALPRLIDYTPDRVVRAAVAPMCAAVGRWRRGTELSTLAAVAATAVTTTRISTAVGFLPSLQNYDQYAALPGIAARTVVISGGRDPLLPSAHGRDLAARIRGAQHVHLPHAGHMLPQQAPHILNDAISSVIAFQPRTDGAARQQPRRHPIPA